MARAQRKPGSLHATSQEPVIQRRGTLDQPASGGFVAVPPFRCMLVPPASAFGDFVRDISLFRLIVIVEMPRQIPDGTEPERRARGERAQQPCS